MGTALDGFVLTRVPQKERRVRDRCEGRERGMPVYCKNQTCIFMQQETDGPGSHDADSVDEERSDGQGRQINRQTDN